MHLHRPNVLIGIAVSVALTLTACGSSRSVIDKRDDVTSRARVLQVKTAAGQTGLQVPADCLQAFTKRLERTLFHRKAFLHGTDGLTLTYTFANGDEGSRAARFWLGFGAGAGSIVVKAVWTDADGKEIARSTHTGTVSGGATGGSWTDAFERCAKEVATFARTHFLER